MAYLKDILRKSFVLFKWPENLIRSACRWLRNWPFIVSTCDLVSLNFCQKLCVWLYVLYLQVLHISDILEHSGAINHRSVVILLVFLSSQLTVKKTMVKLEFFCWIMTEATLLGYILIILFCLLGSTEFP